MIYVTDTNGTFTSAGWWVIMAQLEINISRIK